MNFCPPKPGSTVITRATSIWLANGASCSTAVPGLMASPTCRRGERSGNALPPAARRGPRPRAHLHAVLADVLNERAGAVGGLQVEGVLVGASHGHGLHPLLGPGHHHVHVCGRQAVSESPAGPRRAAPARLPKKGSRPSRLRRLSTTGCPKVMFGTKCLGGRTHSKLPPRRLAPPRAPPASRRGRYPSITSRCR